VPQVALGELIRRERERRGETEHEAAARFCISELSYFRWESCMDRPEDDTFAAIARYLGLRVDEVWEMAHGADTRPDSTEAMRMEIAALWRMVDAQRDALAALRADVESVLVPVPAGDRPMRAKRAAGKAPSTKAAGTETKPKNARTKTAASPRARKQTP
jgi:transcriptional regulator with XRE-family HTH domain